MSIFGDWWDMEGQLTPVFNMDSEEAARKFFEDFIPLEEPTQGEMS